MSLLVLVDLVLIDVFARLLELGKASGISNSGLASTSGESWRLFRERRRKDGNNKILHGPKG